MSQTLIAYYTVTGQTEKLAHTIADITGGILYHIQLAKPYTKREELDWQNPNSRCSLEMNNPESRPQLAEPAPDLSGFDTVFLGFPIWWNTAPHAVLSFLDSAKLKDKKFIVFCTAVQSEADNAAADLKALYPDAIWGGAKRMLTGVPEKTVKAWIESLK